MIAVPFFPEITMIKNPDWLPHSFQSEHSPRGAAAAFSLGHVGSGGGFSLGSGQTGRQDVFIGYFREGTMHCLPYNRHGREAVETGMAAFIPTGDPEAGKFPPVPVRFFESAEIQRSYLCASDTWTVPGLSFQILNPVRGVPNPATAGESAFRDAICPGLLTRLVFDNTGGRSPMRGFFAVGGLSGFRQWDEMTGGELIGVETLEHYGFAAATQPGMSAFSDMFMDFPFRRPRPNRNFLSGLAGWMVEVPAGAKVEVAMALGWYREGTATLGKNCRYAYTEHFTDLRQVLRQVLERAGDRIRQAAADDAWLAGSGLSPERQFLFAKALRSYWGNSQLFRDGSQYRWVLNEGSCNMINTLDLTVDMAFFEAAAHPWLLANVLDSFTAEYAYFDGVHFPHQTVSHPGGLSFTHDQGRRDVFSRPGYSHYEATDHPACFSYMTHEELLNWILCAGLCHRSGEAPGWLSRQGRWLALGLQSMLNRDHPDPARRDGVMDLDADRCGRSEEITTYDSLDPSLGQARRNSYLAVKCWAAYLVIEWLLREDDPRLWSAEIALAQASAKLAAGTVTRAFDETLGYIPAILEPGDRSAIIPVIEGLAYPYFLGLREAVRPDGPYGHLIEALRRHLLAVLQPGRCLFPDGGWKLSGNNDNSWMSKIFLCQFAAEAVLGLPADARADRAHALWWAVGCARHSVIDQVIAGACPGEGATYPRTVSAILWMAPQTAAYVGAAS